MTTIPANYLVDEKGKIVAKNLHGDDLVRFVENYLKEQHKHIELNLGFYPYADYEPMCFWGDITKLKSILTNE